jgi:hypothetical protein
LQGLAGKTSEDDPRDENYEAPQPRFRMEQGFKADDAHGESHEAESLHYGASNPLRQTVSDEQSDAAADRHGDEVDDCPEPPHAEGRMGRELSIGAG